MSENLITGDSISDGMNAAQAEAVSHYKGAALVLAGPGSGKTFVITNRVKCLICEYKVSPESILVITFTKAASEEMKSRFISLIQGEFCSVTFGTFHSIYFQIISHTYNYTSHDILKEFEKEQYIFEILENMFKETDTGFSDKSRMYDVTNAQISYYLTEISRVKNDGVNAEDYEPSLVPKENFALIYNQYERRKDAEKKIDFDDMILKCYMLFKECPDILAVWQNKYEYILIDEFQDINPLQYDVVKLLAGDNKNIFAVGDDDQSIYGFRGARPDIMRRFLEEFKARNILLSVNYRSNERIVKAAGIVINENTLRFPKDISARGNAQGGDKSVILYEFEDKTEESANVMKFLLQCMGAGRLSETALIYRTHSGAAYMAEQLILNNIPFTVKENLTSIYSHFISKDIASYLRLANGDMKREDFLRVMNRPKRSINRNACAFGESISFDTLERYYAQKPYMMSKIYKLKEELSLINNMTPYAAINYIKKGVGYEDFLEKYAMERGAVYTEYEEVLNGLMESAKLFDSSDKWLKHMIRCEEVLKKKKGRKESIADRGVTILTMHGSKGLEFPIVILTGINEGMVPHKKSLLPEEIEEERRIFYVAMTRAKEKLLLFYRKKGESGETLTPSRFLKNLIITSAVQ